MSKIKPSIDDLNSIELTEKAEQIFTKAFDMTDADEALILLTELVGNPVEKVCKVKKYSSETGEPEEVEWKPYEVWDGRIFINAVNLSKRAPVYEPLLKRLPPNKATVIKVKGNFFIVDHVPEYYESEGTTPAFIRLRKDFRP